MEVVLLLEVQKVKTSSTLGKIIGRGHHYDSTFLSTVKRQGLISFEAANLTDFIVPVGRTNS